MDDDQLEHGIVRGCCRHRAGCRCGVRSKATDQESDTTASVTPAAAIQPSRRRQSSVPASHQPASSAGPQTSAASILTLKATPSSAIASDQRQAAAAQRRPGRQQQEEDQPGIGVVGAVDRDGDRHQGQQQGGDESGRGDAERPAHQPIEQRHRGDAGQRLRQMDRPAAEAQHLGEGGLDPEGDRRLVERDEARRIERIVEEQRAALQHAAHAGGVVLGAEAVGLQPPQPQDGRQQQDGADADGLESLAVDACQSSPAGLRRSGPPHPAHSQVYRPLEDEEGAQRDKREAHRVVQRQPLAEIEAPRRRRTPTSVITSCMVLSSAAM